MAVTTENCFLDRVNEKVKRELHQLLANRNFRCWEITTLRERKRTSSRETQWLIIEQHLKQEVGQESFF